MKPDKVIFHRDGTVTYWSVYRQCWVREAVERIPPAEVAAMPFAARVRVSVQLAGSGERVIAPLPGLPQPEQKYKGQGGNL